MHTSRTRQEKVVRIVDILPPERTIRKSRARSSRTDVVDAQFVTLRRWHDRNAGFSNADRRGMPRRTVAGRIRDRAVNILNWVETALSRLSADMFSAVLAMIFAVVFGLAGGFSLFTGAGNADAGPSLGITHVSLTPQDANGMRVLLINGIVENRGAEKRELPSIRADLLSGETVLNSTLISAPVQMIESGRSHGFSARVPHPGGKLPDLRLSFAPQGA